MINRTTKLRWRRRLKRSKKQVEDFSTNAEENIDRHFFRRLGKLTKVGRFVGSWILLLVLLTALSAYETYSLSGYYQTLKAVPGGNFSEGIVGNYTNANPIFATSDVDTTVSKLVFAGLLTYNQQDQLVGDLAQSWTSDDRGITWTVTLRPNLYWQDGQPLTAADVAYTFNMIENPDTQSPLFSSWRGVQIKVINPRTIIFTLPSPLASFPESLTTGIIPQHILANIPASEMRSVDFNTISPVGAGPFSWGGISVQNNFTANREIQIGLVSNKYYHAGKPKLDGYTINVFNSQQQMINSFKSGSIDAMVGLTSLPKNLANDSSVFTYNIPLTAEVMVFLKTTAPILSDVKVRQALVRATNETSIINGLSYPVIPARSPLLPFQIGYNPSILQLSTNVAAAKQELDQDGWLVGKDGIRYKNNQPLEIQLVTQNQSEYTYVASQLQTQWKEIGVNLQVLPEDSADFQGSVGNHAYDALLYGISIGVDPDVFVYWDSSQASLNSNPHLNLSEYKSPTADASLEAGRTRTDPQLRAIKYQAFLQSWQQDAPAIALYQPRFFYVTRGQLFNFDPTTLNTSADRLSNVANWEIREIKVSNI